MPARKKSGKITLRMDPDIHARVAKTAKAFGTDINGLLNWIIRLHLPDYEARARWQSDPKLQRVRRSLDELIVKLAANKSVVKPEGGDVVFEETSDWRADACREIFESSSNVGRLELLSLLAEAVEKTQETEPIEKPGDRDEAAFEKTKATFMDLLEHSSDQRKQILVSMLALTGLAEVLTTQRRAEPVEKPEAGDVA